LHSRSSIVSDAIRSRFSDEARLVPIMMKRRTLFPLVVAAFFACVGSRLPERCDVSWQDIASAQQDWRQEFEDVCSRTQDAMTLSAGELTDLVARCDALKPAIEKLEETPRKVYLKRLQMCRDLFVFVLESKMNEQKIMEPAR
jgi:hypothetical protein